MKDRRVIIERPRKGGKTLEALEAERGYWKERVATLEHERDQYREALAAFLDEAALLHFIAELKRNTGIMDPERGGILNYLRQAGDEPTPAFIITTDDNLSEADTEKLLADLEITARPAGPAGCARCGDPHHRLDDCPDYDPDDDGYIDYGPDGPDGGPF